MTKHRNNGQDDSQPPPDQTPAAENTDHAPEAAGEPLRSVHTSNLPAILEQLGISLLVTTYQAGKLVVVRPDLNDRSLINTHFRNFSKPMGMAAGRG
ncbi:MAG: DUF4915 domain-containing protein, partial [Pirellulales bacterium]